MCFAPWSLDLIVLRYKVAFRGWREYRIGYEGREASPLPCASHNTFRRSRTFGVKDVKYGAQHQAGAQHQGALSRTFAFKALAAQEPLWTEGPQGALSRTFSGLLYGFESYCGLVLRTWCRDPLVAKPPTFNSKAPAFPASFNSVAFTV